MRTRLPAHLTASITQAARSLGKRQTDAIRRAVAGAYRDYGRAHPGRYAATVRAPRPDDAGHTAAADAVLRVVFAVLAGYGITGDDAIDAARALRAALHGFLALEAGGGFGMPRDIDRSYQRFITAFDTALGTWAGQPARPAGDPGPRSDSGPRRPGRPHNHRSRADAS